MQDLEDLAHEREVRLRRAKQAAILRYWRVETISNRLSPRRFLDPVLPAFQRWTVKYDIVAVDLAELAESHLQERRLAILETCLAQWCDAHARKLALVDKAVTASRMLIRRRVLRHWQQAAEQNQLHAVKADVAYAWFLSRRALRIWIEQVVQRKRERFIDQRERRERRFYLQRESLRPSPLNGC